jgi:hypothetical protein
MKNLATLLFIVFTSQALANCKVYVDSKEFNHAGHTILFDFYKVLKDKNYQETYQSEDADLYLWIEGEEVFRRHFHHAVSGYVLQDKDNNDVFRVSSEVRCLTQFCGISDFGKSFKKSFKVLAKKLPACQ